MIKIHSYIIFKNTALLTEVKASFFRFQKAKAALARVVINDAQLSDEHILEDLLDSLLSKMKVAAMRKMKDKMRKLFRTLKLLNF